MPAEVFGFFLTIITHDVHSTLQVIWHRLQFNISRPCLPSCCHWILTNYSLLTNWASIIETSEVSKAVRMNTVAARQILWTLSRTKHIFTTHWTIIFVLILHTIMCIVHRNTYAHRARGTVFVVLLPTDAAETTLITAMYGAQMIFFVWRDKEKMLTKLDEHLKLLSDLWQWTNRNHYN